jgi:glycogen debranching enzyme
LNAGLVLPRSLGLKPRTVGLEQAPQVLAEASDDLLVCKGDSIFICSRLNGDIHPGLATGESLYTNDTRHLSEFRVTLGGALPVLLSSSAGALHKAVIHAANPDLRDDQGRTVPQLTMTLSRSRLLADRLYERIELVNNGREVARTNLEIFVAADFADIFEARGMRHRMTTNEVAGPTQTESGLRFACQTQDRASSETDILMKSEGDVQVTIRQ